MKKHVLQFNKKGGISIISCGVVMFLLSLVFVISSFMEQYTVLKEITESLQAAALTVATENFDESYASKREAASGGYVLNSQWIQAVDEGKAAEQLKNTLGLFQHGNVLLKRTSTGIIQYELSDLKVVVYNSTFQSITKLKIEIECNVRIPTKNNTFTKTLKTSCEWQQKY